MNKIYSLLALSILVLTSCNDSSIEKEKERIIGQWDWQQSSGGLAGTVNTPESVGHTLQLEFIDNGIYSLYVADTLQEQGNYTITNELSVFGNDPLPTITYEFKSIPQAILLLSKDSLIIADECLDCLTDVFIRIQDDNK